MPLIIVPPDYACFAWETEGASCLGEVCELVEEITPSQLKMMLSRGERTLVKMEEDGKPIGWGAFRIDQLPNLRVLHITDLVAHNAGFERFFEEIKQIARRLGCSEIRNSCPPAQARLYRMKCGFESVYETLRIKL